MYRISGDEVWRERAWAIFLAIENACRTRIGYASIRYVHHPADEPVTYIDEMPR